MEKVYVTTFCELNSYGSVLQSLGLKGALCSLGFESAVLKERPASKKDSLKLFKNKSVKGLAVGAHKILIRKKLEDKLDRINGFLEENLDFEYFGNYEKLKKNPPKAKAFIAGSDQIWNPRLMSPLLFLDFAPRESRRISYAASMGVTKIADENIDKFKDWVEGFDSISVREADNKSVIGALTDKNIDVNIDPVFLCGREAWRRYEKPYDIKKPYVLVYAIYWDKKLNRELRKMHRETGMDIVLAAGQKQQIYANRVIYDADIGQFLHLVDNAAAVVSSSFHGVAMSIVFGKPFCAVVNPSAPSRLQDLLKKTGAENLSIEDLALGKAQNYDIINANIEEEKKKGIDYLKNALGAG